MTTGGVTGNERLGGPGSACILGGSFNPLHAGHVRVAVALHEAAGMERVDFVPAATPPHKPERRILPLSVRMAMVEAAARRLNADAPPDRKPFRCSDIEARREGPSYTLDTLREYHRIEPDTRLFFCLGASDMVVLDSWYEWQQLLQLATFVIATRGEADVDDVLAFMRGYPDVFPEVDTTRRRLNSGFGGELPGSEPEYMHIRWGGSSQAHWAAFLTMPRLDVSGTQLRALWRANRQSLGLVPECVEDVLRDHEAEVGSVWGARGSESL